MVLLVTECKVVPKFN